jgi:hypothetical protein
MAAGEKKEVWRLDCWLNNRLEEQSRRKAQQQRGIVRFPVIHLLE